MRHAAFPIPLLSIAIALAGPAAAVDVTTCGQTIDAGQTGVLQVDLDCPIVFSPASFGVVLANGGRLELNGHVLGGAFHGVFAYDGKPAILGPGEITGAYSYAVSMSLGNLAVDGVDIHHNGAGIALSDSSLRIRDSAVRDNDGSGVALSPTTSKRGRIRAVGVDVSGNGGPGLTAVQIRATDLTASDNGGDGLRADKINAKEVIADGNGGFGIVASRVSVKGAHATGNADGGILATRVRAIGALVDANGGYGIAAERIQLLKESTVLDNDGFGTGVDLRSVYPPKVVAVDCGLSSDLLGQPWGVCSDDAP